MHADPLSRPSSNPPPSRGLALALVLVVGVALVGLYLWQGRQAERPATQPSQPSAVPSVGEPAPAEPAVRHPIERADADASPQAGLPDLDASDGAILAALAQALAGSPFERVVVREGVVRKFVATVDNIPRKTLAVQLRSLAPVPGLLATDRPEGRLTLGAANAARYDELMRVVEAADPRTLVGLYVRHYPLFQQAYRELGYPNGYFNDRLVAAIDSLVATPDIDGPIWLVQPRVLYEFADPGLEGLPAGQKTLLRMGSDRAARVKAKLREVRALVASGATR